MTPRLIRVLLAVALLPVVLCGCGEKAPDGIVFPKTAEQHPDSTCSWLAENGHFHEKDYYAVFQEYYDRQLRERDYAAAAKALYAVTEHEAYYQFFRKETLETVCSFRKRYSDRLPWQQTFFTDIYTGDYYVNEGKYTRAIACYEHVIAHEPTNYSSCVDIAYAYGSLGFSYLSMGDHEKALKYNLKALSYYEKINHPDGEAGIYDNIALIHLYTKNYSEAEVFFNKALRLHQQVEHKHNVLNTLYNKILLYQETGSPQKYALIDSTYHLLRAGDMQDESLDVSLSSFYVNMLLHEGRTEEARQVLDSMKLLVDKLQSSNTDADYHIALAEYEIEIGKGIQEDLIEKALAAAEDYDDFQLQIAFCEVLKDNARQQGDYKKALIFSEKEKKALSNLGSREMSARTIELNKRHQTEKKEHKIALQQRTIASNRTAIALLIALLGGLLLVVIVVQLRQKQKKIRSESRRVKLYTKQLLEKTEEERKRIASDLHDSVSHELLNLKQVIGGNTPAAGTKIDAIINDIRSISRNLHPVMFEKVGLTASIEQLVERAQSVNGLMVTSDVVYHASLSVTDELQVYRIVQEALSNIIKYAEAVAAKITIHEENNDLRILIRDNGKGFNVAETLSGGKAFGLHNIIERSHAIGGVARILSDKGGTTITIDLKQLR